MKLRNILLVIVLSSIFFGYHFLDMYAHERSHVRAAINHDCDAKIDKQGILWETNIECPKDLAIDKYRNLNLALSIQEGEYSSLIFHRFIVLIILFVGFMYAKDY